MPVFCVGMLQKRVPEKAVAALRTLSESTGGVAHLLTGRTDFIPGLLAELDSQYWLTVSSPAAASPRFYSLAIKSGRGRIAAPRAIFVQPPGFGTAELKQARDALTGEHKDTDKARSLLLTIVQSNDAASPQTAVWAFIYLGYIEDRANNRQAALAWFEKALAVNGAPFGSLRVATFGMQQPLVWIRHLDVTTAPRPPQTVTPQQ